MKFITLLDDGKYLEIAPDRLQLRQLAVNQATLGVEIVNGENSGFLSLVNFAVNITKPDIVTSDDVAQNVDEVKKRSGRKNMKVPKAN